MTINYFTQLFDVFIFANRKFVRKPVNLAQNNVVNGSVFLFVFYSFKIIAFKWHEN